MGEGRVTKIIIYFKMITSIQGHFKVIFLNSNNPRLTRLNKGLVTAHAKGLVTCAEATHTSSPCQYQAHVIVMTSSNAN